MNFIFDIDGTICFDGNHIDQSIKNRLMQLNDENHKVIFASARPIRDLLPVIPEFADYNLIGGNGSIISKTDKSKSYRKSMNTILTSLNNSLNNMDCCILLMINSIIQRI